ncbi:hypothetical protein [Psychroserpens sp.]
MTIPSSFIIASVDEHENNIVGIYNARLYLIAIQLIQSTLFMNITDIAE